MEGFSRAIEVASEAPVKPAIIPLMPAENSAGTAGKRRTSPLGCDDQMGRHPGGSGEPMGRCTLMSVDVVESARLMPCLI